MVTTETRRGAIVIVLPVLVVIVTGAIVWFMLASLPDPVAIHFSPDGSPDQFLSRGLALPWIVGCQGLVTALLIAAVRGTPTAMVGTRLQAAVPTFSAALVGSVSLAILSTNIGQDDAVSAILPPSSLVLPVTIALALGAVAVALAPRIAVPVPVARPPAGAPRSNVVESVAVWQGVTPSSLAMQVALLVVVTTAVLLWFLIGGIPALLLLLAGLPVLASLRYSVTVGPGGLVVRGSLGWPRVHVPLTEITHAGVGHVAPMSLYGWGWRARRRTISIVTRFGAALVLTGRDEAKFVVTLDRPEVPAGLVNTLIDLRADASRDEPAGE
ncbi:MAG TPA: hypothetical protein VF115_08445 [Acidimicrobiia bacterium]